MKIAMKRFVSAMLLTHAMAIPVTTSVLHAAPPFDPPAASSARGSSTSSYIGLGSPEPTIHTTPYFTDSYGNILMNVNVWGSATHTGTITVPEGSDLSTVISLAGGPGKGANLEKVRINRSQPDRDGKMTYLVNLSSFSKYGDRTGNIDMLPNDTVIIPESRAIDAGVILSILAVGISAYSLTR